MEVSNLDQYKTAQEIAVLWGMNTRTVQNLCKNGKLEGAVKHGGRWFIPNHIPNPIENDKNLIFYGTKKVIFDNAIKLFMSRGYEYVSIKDIADSVGIMQSAIYNHFLSKQKILDTMYDYFVKHFNGNQITIEEMKEILKNGTKEEFCSALMFTFESQDQDTEKQLRMFLITKIIYMRLYQDDRARDIFLNIMNSDVEAYVQEILEYGVSIGVLEEFDIPTYAKFLIGQRHIMGIKAFATPNYEPKQLEEEKRIMKMSADMLPYTVKK